MKKIRTMRGKDGVSVALYQRSTDYFIESKGKAAEARITRAEDGTVIGVERFNAPTQTLRLVAVDEPGKATSTPIQRSSSEFQAGLILKSLEEAPAPSPPPPLPEPDASEVLGWLGKAPPVVPGASAVDILGLRQPKE
jgi:hypothetical protein